MNEHRPINELVPVEQHEDPLLGLNFPMEEIIIAQTEGNDRVRQMQAALRDRQVAHLKQVAEEYAKAANAASVLATAIAKRIARLEARRPRA